MKKILLSLVLVLAILGVFRHQKVERFLEERKYYKYFSKIGIGQKCYQYELLELLQIEGLDYLDSDQKATKLSYDKLINLNQVTEKKSIPLISHRIYFTDEKNPSKVSEAYLEIIKDSYIICKMMDIV